MPNLKQSQEDFEIYFQGQISQVDVNTLINSLVNFSTAIQQINQELGPEKNIEVKIKPFAPGSFIISAALIEAAKANLPLLKEGLGHLGKIVDFLVGILQLKQFLKGEDPKSVTLMNEDRVSVENITGDKMTFYQPIFNIYQNNQVLNDAVSKNFETLREDETIDGLQIKRRKKVLFDVSNRDFVNMSKRVEVSAAESRSIVRENTSLNIIKLVFQEDNKWAFLYDGNKISANIGDEEFYKQIDEGMRFAKGDTLLVDLKVRQIYDSSVNGYVNESFEIVKVKKHVPRPEQQRLV